MTDPQRPTGLAEDQPEYHLPPQHWPLPELSTVEDHPHPATSAYVRVQRSADFTRLRGSFRSFAFPTVIAVLAWYFFYVLASTFAEEFMSTPAFGNLNLGMVVGLLQFPTTWFATWFYLRRMNTRLDPLAAQLRHQIETETAA